VRHGIQAARVVVVAVLLVLVVGSSAFFALTSSFTSREYGETPMTVLFIDRIVTRMPQENVEGAEVWGHGAPVVGAGWASDIASVLPGTQFTLSNLIHAELGGGDKGNSVLGMWVDVFYNFGWSLSLPIAVMVGVLMALFNHWVNVMRSRSRSADICGLWISITMLMVLSPFGFLLYGPFLLFLCLLALASVARPLVLVCADRPLQGPSAR
jgi:hypothetical protein